MEMISRPGSPARIHLGGNYAQPAVSFEAIPGGNDLDRLESYLGNRNCGAPYHPDEERRSENVQEAGERKGGSGVAELEMLKRFYAVRDSLTDVFVPGSSKV
ncbi:MAG: hypothetical protein PVJ57_00495 [Phycisphaerae bacterium]|jgi:hypothetical protein